MRTIFWFFYVGTLSFAQLIDPITPYTVSGYQFAQQVPKLGRHLGEDVHATIGVGTPVLAIADGNVILSKIKRPGYGQYVVISHSSPVQFVTVYGHLSRQPQYPMRGLGLVKKGDVVGYVGSTSENGGWSPHLHVGVYLKAPDGKYHYWGYAPNVSGDDVDVDALGSFVGGFFTKPATFIADHTAPAAPTELYQTPLYNDPSLISYWRFEGNANDSKGSNNGTAFNVSYGTSYGKFGQGAYFNGSATVAVPDAPSLDPSAAITFSMWLYPTGTAFNGEKPLDKSNLGDPGGLQQWALYTVIGGSIYGLMETNGGTYDGYPFTSGDAVTGVTRASITNQWTLITVTYDGANLVAYINGVPRGFAPLTGQIVPSWGGSPGPLNIGSENGIGETHFQGYIDDVAIFSRALTPAEVLSLYTGNWP